MLSGSLNIGLAVVELNPTPTDFSGYKSLLIERREKVLIVKFNRPSVQNAINSSMYHELIRVLESVKYVAEITVVVFTGVGTTSFTSGIDIAETAKEAATVRACEHNADDMENMKDQLNNHAVIKMRYLLNAIIFCPKILVAMVNGINIGMGFTLTSLCDIVYCTENAYFEAPFSRLGLCPEFCSSFVFPRIFGKIKAADILYFGSRLTATEAYNLKFVTRIFKTEELESKFWSEILRYSHLPVDNLRYSKQLLTSPIQQELLQAFANECKVLRKMRLGTNHIKAIELFFENRKQNKSKL